MSQLLHVMPDPFPGVLYDGGGSLLAGDGPALFNDDLVDANPARAFVSRKSLLEQKGLRAGDRIWLLPENFDASVLPSGIVAELIWIIHHDGKAAIAARAEAPVKQISETLLLLLKDCQGNT